MGRRDAASAPEGALKPPDVARRGNTQSIPHPGVLTNLDSDLWAALAILDRVLGTDQVTVVGILPGRPA